MMGLPTRGQTLGWLVILAVVLAWVLVKLL